MKIERLDLRAFGPFTGVALDFASAGPGLFVVHGRNEAGKSSALRAIDAALFGIPGQTNDDFVHEYGALRLGFALRNDAGARIECVRRKANKNSLRDAQDDATIAEEALRPFLGSVDRDEFQRVFGLDHVRLREGGDRLLEASSGEGASSALLSAALGIRQFRSVRDALDSERGDLFQPRASKPEINSLIARFRECRSEIASRSLAATSYAEKKREVEAKERERDDAVQRRTELNAKVRQLELVKRNRSRVRQLAELREVLAALASIPDLPEELSTRRIACEEKLRAARIQRDRFAEEYEQRKKSVESLARDFSLLEARDEFLEIQRVSNEVAKALADSKRISDELAEQRAHCAKQARSLGLPTPLTFTTISELRRALAGRDRCDTLVRQRSILLTQLRSQDERLADLERERDGLEKRASGRSELPDDAALDRALRSARTLGDIERRIAELERALAECEVALTREAAPIRGAFLGAEAIASAHVPGPQEIADFERRFLALEHSEENARARRVEIERERGRLEVNANLVASGGVVPSEADLGTRREIRDQQWQCIRRAWLEGANVDVQARALDPDRSLPAAFEHSLTVADQVADALRRESARVAELANIRAQIAKCEVDLATQDALDAATRADRAALESAWNDAWNGSGFAVGRPAEMKDQLQVRDRLIEKLANRRRTEAWLKDERTARDEAIASVRGALETMASSIPSDVRSLSALLTFADAQQQTIERERKERETECKELTRIETQIGKSRDARTACESALAEWQSQFAAETRGWPLREGDPPEAVPRLLDEIHDLVTAHDEIPKLADRIEKIDRDAHELDRLARAFQAARAPDLAVSAIADFVAAVDKRFEQLTREEERHRKEESEFERVTTSLRSAEVEEKRCSLELAAITREANANSVDELPELLKRAQEKREARIRLDTLERELEQEDVPLATIEGLVRVHAELDLEALREPLAADLRAAEADANAKRDAATQARRDLTDLEKSVGTAELTGELASLTAETARRVAEYARLTLASNLLSVAVERFRRQNEAPLLKNASRHFERLTRSRYVAVDCDFDDDGEPFFAVRAAEGTVKRIDALSDGTRDQLHLALVLGSLELRFDGGTETMPLVLDDVLVHFDDDRSLAALEALAEFGKRTQILLFTHHDRIAEQARSLAVTVRSLDRM